MALSQLTSFNAIFDKTALHHLKQYCQNLPVLIVLTITNLEKHLTIEYYSSCGSKHDDAQDRESYGSSPSDGFAE